MGGKNKGLRANCRPWNIRPPVRYSNSSRGLLKKKQGPPGKAARFSNYQSKLTDISIGIKLIAAQREYHKKATNPVNSALNPVRTNIKSSIPASGAITVVKKIVC